MPPPPVQRRVPWLGGRRVRVSADRRRSGLPVGRLDVGHPVRHAPAAISVAQPRRDLVHQYAGEPLRRTARSPHTVYMCAHQRTHVRIETVRSHACETTRLRARRSLLPCRDAGALTRASRAMALHADQVELKGALRSRHASRTSAYPRAHSIDARLPDRSSFCPDVKLIAR